MMKSFYLPAEWGPQDAVLLTWPHPHSDWAALLTAIEAEYLHLVRAITAFEQAIILCYDDTHRNHVQQLLQKANIAAAQYQCIAVTTNDTWIRDYGPISVFDEQHQPWLLDFQFNAWGSKYNCALDNQVCQKLQQKNVFPRAQLKPLASILEGGAIDSNGAGSLLTTSACLGQRQPMSRAEYQQLFAHHCGIQQVLWLDASALMGDDTDGHVDTLARFTAPDTICYTACDDKDDMHYRPLKKMAQQLQTFTQRNQQPFQLQALPWPKPQYRSPSQRLPLTYANFLIINAAVLVPAYGEARDDCAVDCLQELFPKREIIKVPSHVMIQQNGSIHCATMQIPQGVLYDPDH
jgi:agmatine/peptidylarginine deiminase